MDIKVDTRIRDKYHKGFDREKDVSTIVLHGTGGGSSSEGLIKWMLGGERAKSYERGIALFHYLIDREGEIIELIDPNFWVYHSSSGRQDQSTIGIELINPHPTNEDEYTDAQYESIFELIFDELFVKFPVSEIVSHNRMKEKYSNGSKDCPNNFSWDALEVELERRDINYEHTNKIYDSYWGLRNEWWWDRNNFEWN